MRCFLLPLLALALATPARAEEPLVQKVRKSLDEGIKYLKSKQKDEGAGRWSWDDATLGSLQKGGPSCLAMLALLTAGVPADDPVVKRGLPFIRGLSPENTYVVGLQTMVFAQAGYGVDRERIPVSYTHLTLPTICSV